MSRLVMFLGILLIVVGGAGMIFGTVGAPLLIANSANQLSDPKAADLCKPGEELVTERGAESYSYDNGYSHSQYYYCVGAGGKRRDVTLDAAKNFIGGFLPSMGSLLIPLAASGLCTVGVFMAVLGFIFSRRGRSPGAVTQYAFAGAHSMTVSPPSFAPSASPSAPQSSPPTASLSDSLRQIEDARKSGLINEDEYNRLRKEILDSMQ